VALSEDVLAPEHLREDHDLSQFSTGLHASLDQWLALRARRAEGQSARTYVACLAQRPKRVIGYYCIQAAMEQRLALPTAKLRQGLPDQVPLLLIGRLGVDQAHQGRGIGSALLVDAVRRCVAASDIAGARGIVAHAIDEAAAAFYRRHGFVDGALGAGTMLLPMETGRLLTQG
jgi:GNAT superfamily N-acetyltransferase